MRSFLVSSAGSSLALFLKAGSAPASRSSATVLMFPLSTAACRADVPFWKKL